MSEQEIFDRAWRGLKGQGFEQALSLTGACRYRSPTGGRCAVGHLVPDDVYDPNMEGWSIGSGGGEKYVLPCLAACGVWDGTRERQEFLVGLQMCHDKAADMEEDLRRFARNRSLTIPAD